MLFAVSGILFHPLSAIGADAAHLEAVPSLPLWVAKAPTSAGKGSLDLPTRDPRVAPAAVHVQVAPTSVTVQVTDASFTFHPRGRVTAVRVAKAKRVVGPASHSKAAPARPTPPRKPSRQVQALASATQGAHGKSATSATSSSKPRPGQVQALRPTTAQGKARAGKAQPGKAGPGKARQGHHGRSGTVTMTVATARHEDRHGAKSHHRDSDERHRHGRAAAPLPDGDSADPASVPSE